MFGNRAYRLALCIGAGTGVLYTYRDDIKTRSEKGKKWFEQFKVNAAVTEGHHDITNYTYSSQWDPNWDKRDYQKIANKENCDITRPKATRHILLIRHGQYNMAGDGDEEKYLTALGQEQAKLTGERLSSMGLKLTSITESTMTRAKETSAIIQKNFPSTPVITTDLLREGAPFPPQPSSTNWTPSEKTFFADGARIESAFRKFIHRADVDQTEDSVEVIVCHANVIRYFVCRALQFPPEGWLRMSLRHGSITWLSVRPNGRVSLRCLGESGFMPMDKLTFE